MRYINLQLKNEKGIILIWFYLLIAFLLLSTASLYALSFQETHLLNIDQGRNRAFYLAEAGIDKALESLRTDGTISNEGSDVTLGNGTYRIDYDDANGIIKSTGKFTVDGQTVSRVLAAQIELTLPPGVKAPLTANSNVGLTGNITLDGRDYTYNSNTGQWEVVGDGTYGVSTSGVVSQGGSSLVGGNGVVPAAFPTSSGAIQTGASTVYADPTNPTPEEVLGVAPGSLDQYKTEQPPAPGSKGIFYLTESWQNPNFGTADNPTEGILIVHDGEGEATLKNVNNGYFKGLIITDSVVHLNGNLNIIGGIVVMQPGGAILGNGNANIKYSRSVLASLPGMQSTQTKIVSWQDCQNTEFTYLSGDPCQ